MYDPTQDTPIKRMPYDVACNRAANAKRQGYTDVTLKTTDGVMYQLWTEDGPLHEDGAIYD